MLKSQQKQNEEHEKNQKQLLQDRETAIQMNQDISILKQKLLEHELVLSTSTNSDNSQVLANIEASNANNNGNALPPKIAPIIIRINPDSENNSSDDDDEYTKLKKQRSQAAFSSKALLEKNISLFLNEAKKLAIDTAAAAATAATANQSLFSEDIRIKRKLLESEDVPAKTAKISSSSAVTKLNNINQMNSSASVAAIDGKSGSEEEYCRNQLLQHMKKGEMIKSLRDKINSKRYLCYF